MLTGAGLTGKTIREIWVATLAFSLGLFAFHVAVALTQPLMQKDMLSGQWLQVKLVQQILTAFLGAEVGTVFGPSAMTAIGWAHPIVLALVSAHAISCCTRVPAGEIERGTIDVLLGLPIRRGTLYCGEAAGAALSGLLVVSSGLLGQGLGNAIVGAEDRVATAPMLWVTANLYALLAAIAGIASLFSALCDRRGRAVGAAVAVVVASFFLSSFSPFNAVIKKLAVLSVVSYYRPFKVLEGGQSPATDMVILASIGLACWLIGLILFSWRDIRTS